MTPKHEIEQFIAREFPTSQYLIVEATERSATIRHQVTQNDTRPGGTVSGPTLMGLADAAIYIAIHSTIGLTPHAVTSSLNINFLRRPSADKAIIAVCKLLKVGKTLVVGEVSLLSEGSDDPVAHVVATYAIPQNSPPASNLSKR